MILFFCGQSKGMNYLKISVMLNIRLHFKNFDCVGEVKSFQIVDGNIVRVEVSPEWASRLGAYRLILSYEFEKFVHILMATAKCVVDVLAFNIVPKDIRSGRRFRNG